MVRGLPQSTKENGGGRPEMGDSRETGKEQMQRTQSGISVDKEPLTPMQISRAVVPMKGAWKEVRGCVLEVLNLKC